MALTDSEIQSLRRHLGYGNIDIGAYPNTPDGFLELFEQVVAPNLQTGPQTSSTSAVSVGIATVTPADMSGIVPNARLIIDTGDDAEIVDVKAVSVTDFVARFTKAHDSSGYPIAVVSGESMLRYLLRSADIAWEKLQSPTISRTAGLKSVGKGEVEWFQGGWVLRDTLAHYRSICTQISDLVRVKPRRSGSKNTLSAY